MGTRSLLIDSRQGEGEVTEVIKNDSSSYLSQHRKLISTSASSNRGEGKKGEGLVPSAKILPETKFVNSSQLAMRASTPVFHASLNPSLPFGANKYKLTNREEAESLRDGDELGEQRREIERLCREGERGRSAVGNNGRRVQIVERDAS